MFRSKLVGSLMVSFGLALAAMSGCADQGEGERCDLEAAGPTADCESGLVCTASKNLNSNDADRCCPPEGEAYSDSRCAPKGSVPQVDAGTGGTSGSGGNAGEGGAPANGGAGAPAGGQGGGG